MSDKPAYRQLLPLASTVPPHLPHAVVSKRKRTQVLSACANCRSRKVKCDGARPTCHGCVSINTPCVYPFAEGITPREAQKQKLSSVSVAHAKGQQVLELLRTSHDQTVDGIVKQLRGSDDLEEAVQSIADASLLLPISFGCSSPGSRVPLNQKGTSARGSFTITSPPSVRDEVVSPLDEIMPVSRWTKISQDDKALTHLVNSFWIWDTTLSHLIDRDLFLSSLTGTESETSYSEYGHFCSPLLVNAILAVASLHATRNISEANSVDTIALGHQFANHAFQLLESEWAVSSLTLLQAAAVLWTFASNDGSHHARRQCASLQSLLRQNWVSVDLGGIGSRLVASSRKDDGAPAKMCQAVSHISWGFYCFFSKASVVASPEMLVPRPLISTDPPYSEAFVAECALCEIAAQFVTESACNGLDDRRSKALYKKLFCWQLSFTDHLVADRSVSSSVLLLQASYDFIALRILSSYLKNADTDVFDGHDAASLQIGHASSMMASLWTYRGIHKIRHEYWAAEYCSFTVHELMPLLDLGNATLTVRDIIGKACCIINEMSNAGVSDRAQAILINIEKQAKLSKRIIPVFGRQSVRGETGPVITIHGVRVFDDGKDRVVDSQTETFTVKFQDKIVGVD